MFGFLSKPLCPKRMQFFIHRMYESSGTVWTNYNYPFEPEVSTERPKAWNQYENRPPNLEPNQTSIVLFPGQGSSYVGMGQDVIHIPKVKHMFQAANESLRTNLLHTCLEGPIEKLEKTIHSQPATFIVSLAKMIKLHEEQDDEMVQNCVAVAGFSFGEITALVYAGALTFEQGLHIVRVRAEAMQRVCNNISGSMMTVFTTTDTQLQLSIQAAVEHCLDKYKIEDPCCQIAIHLYPHCKVLAGHTEAIDFIAENGIKFGIRNTKRLAVNGAFHTRLMQPVYYTMKNNLNNMEDLKVPNLPVISSIDSALFSTEWSIKRKLALQIVRPMKWEQTMYAFYQRPPEADYPHTIQPGPGIQLGPILRMCCRKAYAKFRSV